MKVLVTGGAGFIGSNLVDKLLDKKHEVIVIDNLATGSKENLKNSLEKIKFIEYDLAIPTEDIFLKDLGENIDAIVHLAALPRIGRSIDNPLATHQANVNGTFNTLELARKLKVKKFIYSSSSSVYGDHPREDLPLTEEAGKNPMNPYATQKLIGEEYCQIYSKIFKVNTFCLRLFNVYGPRMSSEGAYKLVFGNWILQIKNKQKLTIYGDGQQTRDFTHIKDVLDALILVLENTKSGGEIFNVCSGEEISINELANLFNREVEHIENPRPQEEKFKQGSFKKIHDELGWSPKVKLTEGINMLKIEHDI